MKRYQANTRSLVPERDKVMNDLMDDERKITILGYLLRGY
jgi:hypothetical protein